MDKLRIGIVEDEMIIADLLAMTIRKLGYSLAFRATRYEKALEMIRETEPDLVLLDINLRDQKDGIDLAQHIRANYRIPIIFLTANSDVATVQKAKTVRPNGYLIKPFVKDDLFAAIEIAVSNFEASASVAPTSLLVKDGYNFVKVRPGDIKFLSSDKNYLTLNLKGNRRVVIRSTIAEMHEKLDPDKFIKVKRSFILNLDYITRIETHAVYVDEYPISINKEQRDVLIHLFDKHKK